MLHFIIFKILKFPRQRIIWYLLFILIRPYSFHFDDIVGRIWNFFIIFLIVIVLLLIIIFLLKVNIQMFLKVFLNIFLLHLTVINPTALLLLLKTFRVFLFIFFSDFVFQQIRIKDAFQVRRNYIIPSILINIIDCFIMNWFASLVVICILNFDFELQNFLLCNYSFFLKLLI